MHLYIELMGLLWIALLLFWMVSALGSKRTLNVNWWGWGVRVVMVVVILFVFNAHNTTLLWTSTNTFAPGVQLLGLCITAVGVALAVWARLYLGKNWGQPMSLKENPELVTTGPYAYIRNPIYTGFLLAMLGSSLVVGFYWWLGLLVVMASYFIYSAFQEEKIMAREFPSQYPAYKARTKMLIPFVF